MDAFGDHAVGCHSCGLYARHNVVRDALAKECELAGERTRIEQELPGRVDRPADVFVVERDEADPLAVDVSIVHPLHLSSLKAVVTPGETAEQAEKAKSAHSKETCRQAGWRFTGACAETTGA